MIITGWFLQKTHRNIEISVTKFVGSAKLNFEELHTILAQTENMMNSGPLAYLSNENCEEHITPSHLMYGQNINRRSIVDDNDNIITLDKTLIKTRAKNVTTDTNHFWNRF